jgi:hypothetical protein
MTNLQTIVTAIQNRKVIRFTYKHLQRTVEPFLAGRHEDTGNDSLRAWVLQGTRSSNSDSSWRLYTIDEMRDLEITNQQFSGQRPGYDRFDDDMTITYARV